MDAEGSGRGLIEDILAFTWRNWGKLRKVSVEMASPRTEIWTRDLPNVKQKCLSAAVKFGVKYVDIVNAM
jgi:hypothetical protein